jgi:mannose/fructose/N-acetylgalactosamine-specific phosphotransferase system component IID
MTETVGGEVSVNTKAGTTDALASAGSSVVGLWVIGSPVASWIDGQSPPSAGRLKRNAPPHNVTARIPSKRGKVTGTHYLVEAIPLRVA